MVYKRKAVVRDGESTVGIRTHAAGLLEHTLECVVIAHLHPTVKKCGCGYIGTKAQYQKHYDTHREFHKLFGSMLEFHVKHGEVPINTKEGDDWLNEQWLKGAPKGYND